MQATSTNTQKDITKQVYDFSLEIVPTAMLNKISWGVKLSLELQ